MLLHDPNVDSVLVIFIPPLVTEADDVAAAIAARPRRGPRQAGRRRLHAQRRGAGGAGADSVLRVSGAGGHRDGRASRRTASGAARRRATVPALPDVQPRAGARWWSSARSSAAAAG